jgi:hypothetical protein
MVGVLMFTGMKRMPVKLRKPSAEKTKQEPAAKSTPVEPKKPAAKRTPVKKRY